MIGLLIVQICVVLFWGVEPNNRRLEEIGGEERESRIKVGAEYC